MFLFRGVPSVLQASARTISGVHVSFFQGVQLLSEGLVAGLGSLIAGLPGSARLCLFFVCFWFLL
jgi:hypothetical protein